MNYLFLVYWSKTNGNLLSTTNDQRTSFQSVWDLNNICIYNLPVVSTDHQVQASQLNKRNITLQNAQNKSFYCRRPLENNKHVQTFDQICYLFYKSNIYSEYNSSDSWSTASGKKVVG